jgi:metal-responsive CopG/Arc/MetJ family transcriptional regulator
MEDKKKKKKISISIDKEILENIEKLSTNRSRLVEHILLQYISEQGVDTKNIIL